jgi:aspartate/methionine/tyrosine aminotransferase
VDAVDEELDVGSFGTSRDAPPRDTWAPYVTWEKHRPPAKWDLTSSRLTPCSLDDLPGALGAVSLWEPNEDGYPPLVRALGRRFGVDVDRVSLGAGGTGAMFQALAAFVRPGDRVVVEWPGYDAHPGVVEFLGGEVVPFTRVWEDDFRLDADGLARILTSRTKAVVLTNPHDPTGVYASRKTLMEIGELADSVGAKVIVDEVGLDALSGADTTPAALLGDTFVSVNGFGKSYGLPGLRVGWLLADPETSAKARRIRDVVDGTGSVPSERLAVVAVGQMDRLLERARSILEPNRAMLVDFMAGRPELEWVEPARGSVAFPRLVGDHDAEPFLEMARAEFGVGLVPGTLYGYRQHFRVSVSGAREVLEGGLEALGQALDRGMA